MVLLHSTGRARTLYLVDSDSYVKLHYLVTSLSLTTLQDWVHTQVDSLTGMRLPAVQSPPLFHFQNELAYRLTTCNAFCSSLRLTYGSVGQ